jgi:paraquat-inducible protein A
VKPALVACPDCDAVQSVVGRADAVCVRCGALLARGGARPDRAAALILAALPLFLVANAAPLMSLEGRGMAFDATVLGAAVALYHQGLVLLAALVLLTTVVLPAFELLSLAYLLLWLQRRRLPPAMALVLSLREAIRPWSQIEILLLGMLVAYGKLASLFQMAPGVGWAALVAFLLLEKAAGASLDRRMLWDRLGQAPVLERSAA